MARYRGTVVSGRSAEETFDYMAEFSNGAEWDPGVATAERLDDGPVGLGQRFRLDVKVGGRTTPLDYAIDSYERPHRVVLVGENSFVRSEDTVTVVQRPGGGSVLTYDAELTFQGALAPFSRVLALPFRRIGDRGLDGLRKVLSVGPAAARGHWAGPASWWQRRSTGCSRCHVVGSFSLDRSGGAEPAGGLEHPTADGGSGGPGHRGHAGFGLATAIGVARLGATVRFVARTRDRAHQAVPTIVEAVPGADVDFHLADMGEFDQVREMAAEFSSDHDRLDVLVHNAGALSKEYTVTAAGTELTVASQLVAPFLLSGLLLPRLGAALPSRVIQVSSGGMYTQRFDLDTLESGPDGYDGTVAYARVKRAQLVLMHEWVRRLGGTGTVFHAMHPGWADTPGITLGTARIRQGHGTDPPVSRRGGGHGGLAGVGPRGRLHQRWLLAGPPAALGAQGPLDPPGRAPVRAGGVGPVGVVRRAGGWDGVPPGR